MSTQNYRQVVLASHKISQSNPVQVAVGVIKRSNGDILIALRNQQLHQGGLWEFPGGKLEANETAEQSLVRELKEELDISVTAATPLITIHYQYDDGAVCLHVFSVSQFTGEAKGCEGQPIRWVKPDDLDLYAFPLANKPIINAARLPELYAILDDAEPHKLIMNLELILAKGIRLVQARLKNSSPEFIESFVRTAALMCQKFQAKLLLNAPCTLASDYGDLVGIHLTSSQLLSLTQRPKHNLLLAASCHNEVELQHAERIGVDFVVLAPVLPTPTHPDAACLGWRRFNELVACSNLPVYALGGMGLSELVTARREGAQGIAGIRAFL